METLYPSIAEEWRILVAHLALQDYRDRGWSVALGFKLFELRLRGFHPLKQDICWAAGIFEGQVVLSRDFPSYFWSLIGSATTEVWRCLQKTKMQQSYIVSSWTGASNFLPDVFLIWRRRVLYKSCKTNKHRSLGLLNSKSIGTLDVLSLIFESLVLLWCLWVAREAPRYACESKRKAQWGPQVLVLFGLFLPFTTRFFWVPGIFDPTPFDSSRSLRLWFATLSFRTKKFGRSKNWKWGKLDWSWKQPFVASKRDVKIWQNMLFFPIKMLKYVVSHYKDKQTLRVQNASNTSLQKVLTGVWRVKL